MFALARTAGGPLAPPEFEVEVRLPAEGTSLSAEQTTALRLGTVARVQIPRPGAEALVPLPLAALQWTGDGGGAVARVRAASGLVEQRTLKLSRADTERAFVSAGVHIGEEVWVPATGQPSGASERPGLLQRLFGDTEESR